MTRTWDPQIKYFWVCLATGSLKKADCPPQHVCVGSSDPNKWWEGGMMSPIGSVSCKTLTNATNNPFSILTENILFHGNSASSLFYKCITICLPRIVTLSNFLFPTISTFFLPLPNSLNEMLGFFLMWIFFLIKNATGKI